MRGTGRRAEHADDRDPVSRAVAVALAAVPPPARDRDATAETAALVRWATAPSPPGTLAVEVDTAEAASRLTSLLTRLGAVGTLRADPEAGRWHLGTSGVDDPVRDGPLRVRLGLTDPRGRGLSAPPSWLTGGSLPGAVATWRGALIVRGRLAGRDAVVVDSPTSAAALSLAELALRLGVRARVTRDRGRPQVVVDGEPGAALLLTTCGGRTAALAAGLDDHHPASGEARGSANVVRATVAASRANAAVEDAFTTLADAGVTVPEALTAAGRLRLDHPDLGLADLAARADPPLSKDALAGRLRRLLALAARHR